MAKQEGFNFMSNKGEDLKLADHSVQTMGTWDKTYPDKKIFIWLQTVGKDAYFNPRCGKGISALLMPGTWTVQKCFCKEQWLWYPTTEDWGEEVLAGCHRNLCGGVIFLLNLYLTLSSPLLPPNFSSKLSEL